MKWVNLRRGFNRIFILLWILWGLFCVLQRAKVVTHYEDDIRVCHEEHDSALCTIAEDERRDSFFEWPLLVVTIIVPALAVYAFSLGTGAVLAWVGRGFRPTD